jgi:hypothetical protein
MDRCLRRVLLTTFLLPLAIERSAAGQFIATKVDEPVAVEIHGIAEPYAEMILQMVDEVGQGRADEAIAIMAEHTRREVDDAAKEKLRKLFSAIYGVSGEYDGHELVAVQPVTQRIHKAYAVGYHEKKVFVYKFTMCECQGEWKIIDFNCSDELDALEKLAPVVRIAP